MPRTLFHALPVHSTLGMGTTSLDLMTVVDFLRYVVRRDRLAIAEYLDEMGQEPFFLVAATGLGKTVVVPIHVLIRLMQRIGEQPEPAPRVWVVEPGVPIATNRRPVSDTQVVRARQRERLRVGARCRRGERARARPPPVRRRWTGTGSGSVPSPPGRGRHGPVRAHGSATAAVYERPIDQARVKV